MGSNRGNSISKISKQDSFDETAQTHPKKGNGEGIKK
jgi:hypothetical protein